MNISKTDILTNSQHRQLEPLIVPIDPKSVVIVMAYILAALSCCLLVYGMKKLLNIIDQRKRINVGGKEFF